MLDMFGIELSEDESRKRFYGIAMILDDLMSKQIINKKITLSEVPYEIATIIRDERNALNSDKRIIARKERFYDLLERKFPEKKQSPPSLLSNVRMPVGDEEAILQLSDFHYGIVVDNAWNKYDVDIARKRLSSIIMQFIEQYNKLHFKKTHVVLQGDLISGIIHTTLRLQNQEDVVNQIFGVSSLLTDMFYTLHKAEIPNINVYFVDGNHERITPKKEESLDQENFIPIIKQFIKHECGNYVFFSENKFGNDIATFECNGISVAAVHGDKDPFSKLRDNVCGFTGINHDIILSAHRHHLAVEEDKKTMLISNGSLLGVDDYAKKMRMLAKPSQNLIIVKPNHSICIQQLIAEG